MEPITLVLSALAAGATAAFQETATRAVKDAYEGLKALIQRRFAGNPDAETDLRRYEKDPGTHEKPLQKSLVEAGADKDEDIVRQAQELLKLVEPQESARGKYNVSIGEARGTVIGDHATVEQNFGRE